MAFKSFNAANGFSVGQATPIEIADANGNIIANGLTVSAKANLGPVSNVIITGGSAGQVIGTDGAGNLSFVTVGGTGTLSNGTSNIQVLNNGNITFSSAGNANVMIVTGTGVNVAGTLNATGNANVGNIGAGNVEAANLNLTGLVNATGNVRGGNLNTAGKVVASTLESNVATGTAPIVVASTTRVANLNVAYANVADFINVSDVTTGTYYPVLANAATGNVSEGSNANLTFNAATGALSATLLTGTLTTAAQPNVTSLGTLSSLTVTGNVTAGNLLGPHANGNSNVNIPAANGNVNISVAGTANVLVVTGTGANITGTANISGNANVGNIGAAAGVFTGNVTAGNVYANSGTIGASLLTGTLTTAAQPNITSVGTLSSLSVTANVAAGNLTTTGVLSVTGTGVSSIAGNLDMTSNTIINLADPTSAQDAATKAYVDSVAQGIDAKQSVVYATAAALPAYTYNNGTGGVGATLTGNANGTLSIDGQNVTGNIRVLIKNEGASNASPNNGIYTVTQTGNATAAYILTRSTDMDVWSEVPSAFVFVESGSTNADTGWVSTADATGTMGTTNITWVQFSGAGTYTAGTGLTLTGTQFSVNASQTQITAVGTLTGLTLGTNAAITLSGAASQITGANLISGSFLTGTLTTAAQPNITSVGTLTSLAVTGNASAGNLNTAGKVVASTLESNVATGTAPLTVTSTTRVANLNVAYANVADNINVTAGTGNNFLIFANAATGNVSELTSTGLTANLSNNSITATTFVGALSGAATTAGTVTTAAQPNITSVGSLTSLTVTGNANVGNLGTAQVLATANITTPQVIANVANGTAPLLVNSQTVVANLNADLLDGFNTATAATANTVAVRDANGNITANFFIGNGSQLTGITASQIGNAASIANGNSNVNIPAANGNVNISAVGNANILVVTGTGVNVAGTFNATGNANVGNIGATNGVFTNVSGNGSALTAITGGNVTGQVANALVAGTVYTAAQPNITSVGTLTSVAVTGNATAGNVYANSGTIGAQLLTGTLTTAAQPNITSVGTLTSLSVTGNANVGNIGAAAGVFTTVAGSLTTNAQPNITSVGTLGSLAVTGNTTSGNFIGALANGNSNVNIPAANGNVNITAVGNTTLVVTGTGANITGTVNATGNANVGNLGTPGVIIATGNITSSANLISDNILGRTGALTITSGGTNTNINLKPNGTGNIDANSTYITNVKTPANPNDAATKQYVDDVAQGLNIHNACQAATPNTLAVVTGGTITYNNGSSGVGANLTTTGSFNLIDGVNVQTAGTRILVKNEANAVHNGIYTWSNATVITRATDYDSVPEVEAGDFVFVTGGTLYDNTGWVQTSSPTAIGTAGNTIDFAQFSGAGTYTAGTGLTLTGTTFSITNTAVTAGSYGNGDRVATFTVNAQGQLTAAANTAITANAANLTGTTLASTIVTSSLTSVGTLSSLAVTGNVTAANFIGNLANGNSDVNIPAANGNINFDVAGNANVAVITGTGVNVAGTLNATGNANVGNLGTATAVITTGNITTVNTGLVQNSTSNITIASGANVSTFIGGNATAQFVVTSTGANIAGTLNAVGNANVGNLGTATAVITTGNITTINSGLMQNGNSNVTITANGNVTIAAVGGARITATSTGANVTGTLGVSGNANVLNLGTAQVLATANVTAPQLISNIATGTAPFVVTSTTQVANLSVATAGTAGSATTAGTVTTAAQPNITSVGTLTSLTVSGNTTSGNFIGALANTTSNVNIPAAAGNINLSVGGTANVVVVTNAGANINGVTYANGSVNINNVFSYFSNTASLATVSQTTIDSFTANSAGFGSVKYVIQAFDTVAGVRQISEVLVTANTTTAVATEYAIISTSGTPIATFDVSYASNTVSLLATGASANTTQYKVARQAIAW